MPEAANRILVIACSVFREQMESLANGSHSFIYLDQILHRTPENLREEIQKVIAGSQEYSVLLLGYGLCSRAMVGLRAGAHQIMVIPKMDDCIGIFLGARTDYYRELRNHPGTFYFTKGWVETAKDPLKEYHRCVAEYGEEMALWAARETLKHYQRAALIKTCGQDLEASRRYVQEFARFFNLHYAEIDGSPDYLRKLLFGPWDGDFVVVEGGIPVGEELFKELFRR